MARRLGFKKSHSDILRANDAALRFQAAGREIDPRLLNNLPPKRERAAPRKLEATVLDAVGDILHEHPKVLVAIRINSGAAGERSHIRFNWFVRKPEKMRMSDYIGWIQFASYLRPVPFAFECKRPNWKAPSDDREREQEAYLNFINRCGGIGAFITDPAQVLEVLA